MDRYEQYKDSGDNWLGKRPSHWELTKLKFCAIISPKNGEIDIAPETLVSFTPMENIKDGFYIPCNKKYVNFKNNSQYTEYQEGDIAFAKVTPCFENNNIAIMNGLANGIGYGSSELFILRATAVDTKFLFYLLQTASFKAQGCASMTGAAGLKRVSSDMVKNYQFGKPSIEEQKAIAAYLDSEVSKIDEAIKQQQKMIELLNERRQIIISEAVTKGVNPDVKKANNNVEEIGLIPEHWLLRKFKRVAKVQANLVSPKRYSDLPQVAPENIEKGTGKLLEYTTVSESGVISDNHLFHAGQIIYSKIRPSLNKLIIAPFDGLCSADMYPITTSMNVRFLYYYMLSKPFVTQVNKVVMDRVKMPKINKEELSLIYVLVPPVKEQEDIINYLDNRLKSLDMTIARCKNITDRLTERKRIIINEAVTGKIKVL